MLDKRIQAIKPADSELQSILASYSGTNANNSESTMTSVNHHEYSQKISEHVKAKRPPTSDFWKVGAFVLNKNLLKFFLNLFFN